MLREALAPVPRPRGQREPEALRASLFACSRFAGAPKRVALRHDSAERREAEGDAILYLVKHALLVSESLPCFVRCSFCGLHMPAPDAPHSDVISWSTFVAGMKRIITSTMVSGFPKQASSYALQGGIWTRRRGRRAA